MLSHGPGPSRRFAPARHLDPLRVLHGIRARYDCPDVPTLDRHIARLRRRMTTTVSWSPDVADCRADIDRLLDRRAWLTLPVTGDGARRADPVRAR